METALYFRQFDHGKMLTNRKKSITIWLQKFQRGVCMPEARGKITDGLMYKGHPLRRVGNLIYYGSMADKYIILMQVLNSKEEKGMNIATKVSIQLQRTESELSPRDRVEKKSEKNSLYAAMDLASVWLVRALAGK